MRRVHEMNCRLRVGGNSQQSVKLKAFEVDLSEAGHEKTNDYLSLYHGFSFYVLLADS